MPRLRCDSMVVVDVESTCWEDKNPPRGQWSEIIEIGACLLDTKTLEVSKKGSVFVKPVSSSVSEFCTRLTTIRQSDVDGGLGLGEACRWLASEFDTQSRAWGSYGDYDMRQFTDNCKRLGVQYPFSSRHVNIKWLLAMSQGWGHEVGTEVALRKMNMRLDGTHHRAGDDACNISRLLARMWAASRAGSNK